MKRRDVSYCLTKVCGKTASVALFAMTAVGGVVYSGGALASHDLGTPVDFGLTWMEPTFVTHSDDDGGIVESVGEAQYGNGVVLTQWLYEGQTGADYESFYFRPDWIGSSWVGVDATSDYVVEPPAGDVAGNTGVAVVSGETTYYYKTKSAPEYTLKLERGVDVGSIYHGSGVERVVDTSIPGEMTTVSSSDYISNLIFAGNNQVLDSITVTGDVQVQGSAVYVGGNMSADTLHYDGAFDTTLGGNLTGDVDFNGNDAVLNLDGGDIYGDVDTDVDNSGTLVFRRGVGNGYQRVQGDIGQQHTIREIRLEGRDGVALEGDSSVSRVQFSTGTTLELQGNLDAGAAATTIDLNGTDSLVRFAGRDADHARVVLHNGDGLGTVEFIDVGQMAFDGDLGTEEAALSRVFVMDFGDPLYLTGGGELNLSGIPPVPSDPLQLTIDGEVNVSGGVEIWGQGMWHHSAETPEQSATQVTFGKAVSADRLISNYADLSFEETVDAGTSIQLTGSESTFAKAVTSGGALDMNFVTADYHGTVEVAESLYLGGSDARFYDTVSSGNMINLQDSFVEFDSDVSAYNLFIIGGGSDVRFGGDVTVGEESLVVAERSYVQLGGDLNGDLLFSGIPDENYGGGVLVADGKSVSGSISTDVDRMGALAFDGSTEFNSDIGSEQSRLRYLVFNFAGGDVDYDLNHDLYAEEIFFDAVPMMYGDVRQLDVPFEGVSPELVDVTAEYNFGGADRISVFDGMTTVGVSEDRRIGGNVYLGGQETALNVGVATLQVDDRLATQNASLSFIVDTLDISGIDQSASDPEGSSRIEAGALQMSGSERIHINYLGSLAENGTYTLIATDDEPVYAVAAMSVLPDSYLGNEESGLVSDNSRVIDTVVRQANDADVEKGLAESIGDLFLEADRTMGGTIGSDDLYVSKSGTEGHYSNNAARALAAIAASGQQSGDMVEVIQKLELDAYGYGDTEGKLAEQVTRLAPVANGSLTNASIAGQSVPVSIVGQRMQAGASGMSAGDTPLASGAWLQAFGGQATQDAREGTEGFDRTNKGFVLGAENEYGSRALAGLAVSYATSDVSQKGDRSGDKADVKSYGAHLYGSYQLTPALALDGTVSFGKADYSTRRQTALGRTAEADYDGYVYGASAQLGYALNLTDATTLTPRVSLDYTRVDTESYEEEGAGALNLHVDRDTAERIRTGAGVQLDSVLTAGDTTLRPMASVMYHYDEGSVMNGVRASFEGDPTGSVFSTPESGVDRESFNAALGVGMDVTEQTVVELRYDLETRSGFEEHAGSLKVNWSF